MEVCLKSNPNIKLKGKELAFIFTNLAMLISSGMPMLKALEVLCDITKGNHNKAYGVILDSIKEGNAFSTSCLGITSVDMYISLLAMGEEMGRLEEVLSKLGYYIEEKENFKNKLIKLLIYPSILLMSTIGVSIFICFFILPNIVGILGSSENNLPNATRVILSLVYYAKKEPVRLLFSTLLFIFSLVLIIVWLNSNFNIISKITGGLVFKLWEINFLKILGLSLDSGCSMQQAMSIIMVNEKNIRGKAILDNINMRIMNGSQLSQALTYEREINRIIISFIAIGEEGGNLEKYIKICQELLEKKYYEGINRYLVLLQPLLLVFMGLIIITLIYSVFMPMMNNMYNI